MSLCIEIYKTFSNLNFEFRKGVLRLRMTVRSQREKGNLNLDEIVLDIFFSQIPVSKGGFEKQTSCIMFASGLSNCISCKRFVV